MNLRDDLKSREKEMERRDVDQSSPGHLSRSCSQAGGRLPDELDVLAETRLLCSVHLRGQARLPPTRWPHLQQLLVASLC